MALVVAGREVPCAAVVRDWRETGLEFRAVVHPRIRPRFTVPDTVVWHWTSAENPAEQVYRTLRGRGLGVEFIIDREGTIWQCCDPATTDARDCGSWWDRRSVGVEIVSYGMARPYSKPWSLTGVPKAGRDRPLVETRLGGRRAYVAALYPRQTLAALCLADSLEDALGIPARFALDEHGAVLDRPMDAAERAAWTGGHVGHLQITTRSKPDPGIPCLEQLRAHLEGHDFPLTSPAVDPQTSLRLPGTL